MIKFIVIFLTLFLFLSFFELTPLNNFLAEQSAKVLNLSYDQNVIFTNEVNFIVTNFCTGLVSVAILAGIIFSFKKPIFINKLILFILGSLILIVSNFFRIIFVMIMSEIGFDAESIHVFTWFLMSLLIIIFWFYTNKFLLGYKNLSDLIN